MTYGMTIDGKPLSAYQVTLSTDVVLAASIVQLTGTRHACKALAFHLGCELRQKARYHDETYHLIDDRGEDVGQFHDSVPPRIVFKTAWLHKQR